jgi:hypothetical protein
MMENGAITGGRTSGWWCDGVAALYIEQTSPTSFMIAGSTYWADTRPCLSSFYLAPFEVECCLSAPGIASLEWARVRFGALDQSGAIVRKSIDCSETSIALRRPKSNCDWAIAVEVS